LFIKDHRGIYYEDRRKIQCPHGCGGFLLDSASGRDLLCSKCKKYFEEIVRYIQKEVKSADSSHD
jgi:protein-arginine kinase activator protein McsA